MTRIIRRIGNYKTFKDNEGFWHVSIPLEGVWISFGVGQVEPRIEGAAKLVLEFNEKGVEDANPIEPNSAKDNKASPDRR